jgi:serine/threonine protein kinase
MEDGAGQELVRESSAVINSVLVSDPVVDVEREQVRQMGGSDAAAAAVEANSSTYGAPGNEGAEEGARTGHRSRHDYSNNGKDLKRKETTFGTYILGQTLGEGEFGKVKLGWKRDGSIQVAIKLIRRESLGSNPSRLPKIYREISILRELAHPNIVRLHEMVETDRHIGIIMEYASGGELFDYILNNRYLKDNSARRLFAQLVSGVGYLHKKGIVHRDLKLENLLLDRNRNIIITDFGFANTFNPIDQLEEEIEYNLTNKEYVKRKRLDKLGPDGLRRGDLMQTSCGSPCYAAPELVVSDSLYTGRKVDVWSCGVILVRFDFFIVTRASPILTRLLQYAMLAGYLPFDDDPANPDGDNINLLYKYIVTTPLTFPEYVTPHARDLLRRILVPDPRKRADLFEVARHSWLSEYAHIVSHITSSTTNVADIANSTVPAGKILKPVETIPQIPIGFTDHLLQNPRMKHRHSHAVPRFASHPRPAMAPSPLLADSITMPVIFHKDRQATSQRHLAMLSAERCRSNMLLHSLKQREESIRRLRNHRAGAPPSRRSQRLRHQSRIQPLERHRSLLSTTTSHCLVTSLDLPRTMQHSLEHTQRPPRGFPPRGRRQVVPSHLSILVAFHLEAPMVSPWLLQSQRPTPKVVSHSQRVANSPSRRTRRRHQLLPLAVPAHNNFLPHSTRLLGKSLPRVTSDQTPSQVSEKSCLAALAHSWVVAIRSQTRHLVGIVKTSGIPLRA